MNDILIETLGLSGFDRYVTMQIPNPMHLQILVSLLLNLNGCTAETPQDAAGGEGKLLDKADDSCRRLSL